MEMKEEIKLITLPCKAAELESALHIACDHHGLWNATVTRDDEFVPVTGVPGVTHVRHTFLKIVRGPAE
jgi:hypothetical protein